MLLTERSPGKAFVEGVPAGRGARRLPRSTRVRDPGPVRVDYPGDLDQARVKYPRAIGVRETHTPVPCRRRASRLPRLAMEWPW